MQTATTTLLFSLADDPVHLRESNVQPRSNQLLDYILAMRHTKAIAPRSIYSQTGFTLVEVAVALTIITIAVVVGASAIKREADDSAAESTGRYLTQIRGAVIDLQLRHEAWLRGENISNAPAGTYPTPPALRWVPVSGAQIARGGISDLSSIGLLPASIPRHPPLGDTVRFALVRQGRCPGSACRTDAYVYTCHPISDIRSLRRNTSCMPPHGAQAQYAPALLGKVMVAAGGYGGHDASGGTHVRGPVMNAPRAWFDFGSAPGHAVLAAGLDATPFDQFVRHGETRPVTFHNTLVVGETIQSNKGLLLKTAVVPGRTCAPEGLYASTANKLLAVCTGGIWFAQNGHTITGTYADLPNAATVPPIVCPPGATPWRHVALQGMDATMRGADVNVAGSISGNIQGSGHVNAAGAVTVGGAFSGTFQNAGSSYVRVAQRVSVSGDRIAITPADMGARASVIQGCKN